MLPVSEKALYWVDLFNRFNVDAGRRDKWFRLAQYTSRLIALSLADKGLKDLEIVARLKRLDGAAAEARKLYRIFGSIDFLQKAIDAYRKPNPDKMLKTLTVLGHLGKALWLYHDHLVWMGKIGLLKVNVQRLSKRSAQFWVLALTCLIIRDLKSIFNFGIESIGNIILYLGLAGLTSSVSGSTGTAEEMKTDLDKRSKQQAAFTELLRDCLDLMLPLGVLGWVSPKFAAGCGVASTYIALKQEWKKL